MDGLDANSGLSGVRIGTRSSQPVNTITVSNKSTELAYIPQSESNETDVNEPLVSHASSTLNNPLLALHQPKEVDKKEGCRRSFGACKSLAEKHALRELSFTTDILKYVRWSVCRSWPTPPGSQANERRLGLSKAPETGGYAYPTWSWAGYIGPVEYRIFMADEAGPLPTPLVEKFQIYQNGAEVCVLGSRHPTIPQATHESVHPEITHTNQVDPTIAPTILTFEALVVPITAFKLGDGLQYLSLQEHIHTSGQQAVSRVYDKNEVHCGLCFTILTAVLAEDDKENSLFVAISEATLRNYCGKYSGLTRVEGEVTPCDMDVYGKESAKMINALMITGADVAERISVAIIHDNAWESAMPTRRLVRLG